MIQRGGRAVIRMLPNVQQRTIEPIITRFVAPGSLINTDEHDIYARYTRACPRGVISIRRSVTVRENTRVTRMAMAATRRMSTPWKASGPCCDPGSGLIAASRRRNSPSTSASSSSFIMCANAAEPSSGHSSEPWSHEPVAITPERRMSHTGYGRLFPASHHWRREPGHGRG